MDIGSIFLILAMMILVVLYISRPIIEGKAVQISVEEHDVSMLLAERDRVVNAINELEFDNILGKVPEDDYPSRRMALKQYGAKIMQQLDEISPESVAGSLIETDAPQKGSSNKLPHMDDDLEILIAARRRARQEKTGGFCPQCGQTVQHSDRFCPKCGTTLA
ncbi:MAG: zinc ribbon domain-containing protein [Anaerolineae bacterium]|nr:zinc ribbon domain-containing protein [Anaerolineae bacterium]